MNTFVGKIPKQASSSYRFYNSIYNLKHYRFKLLNKRLH